MIGAPLLAATSPLWYFTRASGIVALVLLSFTVVLGVLGVSRWSSPRWPRFVTAGLHRNLSLVVVLVVGIHIITAELDTFAPVGWLAVIVPFASSYRPLWMGLGTLAFDMLLAVVVTSLLRSHLGYRAWRVVHWLAYISWPVALVHGLGTGTDPRIGWVQLLTIACAITVLLAVAWRLSHAVWSPEWRLMSAVVALGAVGLVVAWARQGPLSPGWAARAGTPSYLLPKASTTSQSTTSHSTAGQSTAGQSGGSAPQVTVPQGNGDQGDVGPYGQGRFHEGDRRGIGGRGYDDGGNGGGDS